MNTLTRKLIGPIRRLNRWWIDRLDPDWPPASPDLPTVGNPTHEPTVTTASKTTFQANGPVSIYSESTPNPNALKFVAHGAVLGRAETWRSLADAGDHVVGQALMGISGVQSAFANADFVTVSRAPGASWNDLEPKVIAALQGLFPQS
ncbi:MAG: hypothetical protein GWP91_07970 [Rhodobacterales bacterium]|nr:hypothetical protein [Rhodobacterales bacterium]